MSSHEDFWVEYLILTAEYETAKAARATDPERWQIVKHKHAAWRTAMRQLNPSTSQPGRPVAQTAEISAEAEMN